MGRISWPFGSSRYGGFASTGRRLFAVSALQGRGGSQQGRFAVRDRSSSLRGRVGTSGGQFESGRDAPRTRQERISARRTPAQIQRYLRRGSRFAEQEQT